MSVLSILKDRVDSVVKDVGNQELVFEPDKLVIAEIVDEILDTWEPSEIFMDLLNYFEPRDIGGVIITWYKGEISGRADVFESSRLREYLSKKLFEYAKHLTEEHEDYIKSYYIDMQREQREAER